MCAFLYFLSSLIVIYLLLKVYWKLYTGKCNCDHRIDGQVVIITGAGTGLGYETARELAFRGGKIYMADINMKEGEEAAKRIKAETNNHEVYLMKLDLSLMESVRKFCSEFKQRESRLDLLVNNAGIAVRENRKNGEGFETHFATNHLGHFLLTNILLERLKKSENGRIVVIASVAHTWTLSLDVDNLNSEKVWEPKLVYAKSKLLNILFMREFNRKLKLANIPVTVNALNPGGVRSKFYNDLKRNTFYRMLYNIINFHIKTPLEGAQTIIHLCASNKVRGESGHYYSDCKKTNTSSLGANMDKAEQVWKKSVQWSKIRPNELFFH